MIRSTQMFFVCIFVLGAVALECYTGFTYIRGKSVGTSKMTCTMGSDYCYNMTADLSNLNVVSKAGCSTTRCFLSRNKCIRQTVAGKELQFCCCNGGDLCNSAKTNQSLVDRAKGKLKDIINIFGGK